MNIKDFLKSMLSVERFNRVHLINIETNTIFFTCQMENGSIIDNYLAQYRVKKFESEYTTYTSILKIYVEMDEIEEADPDWEDRE